MIGRLKPFFCCSLFLAISLAATAAYAQQESAYDRNRDSWQRPADVFDGMGLKPGQRVARS